MEEIKVGEYVRTDRGVIYEYTEEEKNDIMMQDFRLCNDGKIVKHSPNIIDLVQEGDIIEWYSEIYIGYYGINEIINRFGSIGVYAEEFDALIDLKNLTIKSVVTHEQFNQVKYKV